MPYKDKLKHNEWHRIWQANRRKRVPTYNMFQLAKQRAKRKGIEFNLKMEDISIPDICPVFGTKLFFGGKRNSAPSLDRINPLKGYTKDNICVISNRANHLKSSSTLEDLEKIIEYVRSYNARCD